ncbi:hypothetical protein L1987_64797 [Smallanthus sonchifolius]|uniref:Uncharacterized protein n=1 Tax=Smallanthus sonchifolius TaxID=185202 RepID=A0ACB9BSR4_9ASTR|nr:hypothetical protein L1987_64797 [Smallanthus sonchifolius]
MEQSEIRGSDSQPTPRFGEWDDNDPSSSENYSHIFNRIRSEGIVSNKIVLAVKFSSRTKRRKMVKAPRALKGIKSVDCNKKDGILIVIGDVDPDKVIAYAKTIADTKS